jgi:polyphosphate kinase
MSTKNERYFHRELSWIEFNYRVLEEALDTSVPLMERLKFLSIYFNNLDEFIMVRIANLVSQSESGYPLKDESGLHPDQALEKAQTRLKQLNDLAYSCLKKEILPSLAKHGLHFYTAKTLPEKYKPQIEDVFLKKYFMLLTPMAIDQARPFPFLAGTKLNILVTLHKKEKSQTLFAIIPVPTRNRFIPVGSDSSGKEFIYIGELIKLNLHHLFKGYTVEDCTTFRITRDAEMSVDEEDAINLLSAIENELKKREKGRPIRLEIEKSCSKEMEDFLSERIQYYNNLLFKVDGPVDITSFFQIVFSPGNDELKDDPWKPVLPPAFSDEERSIFDIINEKDHLLHLPFDSFDPVTRLIDEAADDPGVLAIKMTLYRTSGDSPIIAALKRAADNGKQVTVLVELKARFDEAQNIGWAKLLEKAGCHVVYGLVGLKTHCKMALVVRDEENGIARYIHLSTGNYNDKTARIYTDIGYFTSKKSFGRDVSSVFNVITGYSEPPRWKKLVCAPLDMRNFFLEKIKIEIDSVKKGGKGLIIAKMNSLIDIKIIDALYEASQADVTVQLIVRGMCRLVPGVKGLSENISVISIVDRFLEHSRIYYFLANGNDEIYLASADWMERNFDRRIETLFPIEEPELKKEILDILDVSLDDNIKARILQPDGSYLRKTAGKSKKTVHSQLELYKKSLKEVKKSDMNKTIQFVPRVNPDAEQTI